MTTGTIMFVCGIAGSLISLLTLLITRKKFRKQEQRLLKSIEEE